MTSVTTIPFSKLVATDAINARAATKDGLDELAASIAAKGLIQPLAVRPADGSDKYEVIDGRRRYAALARLVKDKAHADYTKNTPVPVLVRNEDDAEALETSLMANTVRLPMHPVDQYAVFSRLAEQGKSDADIAARFGIAERTVRQQRALGALAPAVRDAWRKGKIDADTAKAFTLHPDHEVQTRVFDEKKKQGHISEWGVRNALSEQRKKTEGLPEAVLDAYTAAGGRIAEDLFSDTAYAEDAALLDTCLTKWGDEQTADLKAQLLADGWSWVAREKELGGEWRSWPSFDDGNDGSQEDRCWEVEGDEIAASAAKFTAAEKARAGVVIEFYTNRELSVTFGIVRPDGQIDLEEAIDAADDEDGEEEDDSTPFDDDEPSAETEEDGSGDGFEISGALTETVTTSLTVAAAATLREDPELALRAVLAALSVSSWESPVKISATRSVPGVGARAERDFDEELAAWCQADTATALAALAEHAASALTMLRSNGRSRHREADALIAALDPQTFLTEARRAFNAADYFKRASKAAALAAIEEMREAGAIASGQLAEHDALARMKKAELATAAATAAKACGWLPPELRHPAYSLMGAAE